VQLQRKKKPRCNCFHLIDFIEDFSRLRNILPWHRDGLTSSVSEKALHSMRIRKRLLNAIAKAGAQWSEDGLLIFFSQLQKIQIWETAWVYLFLKFSGTIERRRELNILDNFAKHNFSKKDEEHNKIN